MTIQDIQRLVCTRYGISRCDLMSRRRGKVQAVPRQVAMWLSRHTMPHSLPEIGRAFDRDHTTVMAGIARVDERMAADPTFAAGVNDLVYLVEVLSREPAPPPVEVDEFTDIRLRREEAKLLDQEIMAIRQARIARVYAGLEPDEEDLV